MMDGISTAPMQQKRRVLGDVSNDPQNRFIKRKHSTTPSSVHQPLKKKKPTLTTKPETFSGKPIETKESILTSLETHKGKNTSAVLTNDPSSKTEHDPSPSNDPEDDYVEDIFKNLRATETSILPYMSLQPQVDRESRSALVEWLLHYATRLSPETYFLAIDILDRFLAKRRIRESSMVVTGVAALLIAFKYEQVGYVRVRRFLRAMGLKASITSTELIQRETLILETLKYRITFPSPYSFLVRYLRVASQANEELALSVLTQTLLSYDLRRRFKPSQLAAASVFYALGKERKRSWSLDLVICSQYPTVEVNRIAKAIVETTKKSVPPKINVANKNKA
ncbi:B-type cyclin [Seminavis robusta]|uniref:B-type cyclin n=1 Tax=Seminavis robusta TaxID=568900 RepID=A0A9N8DF19_9STRA|nr:B-type cyclin [Seminavis robusta]|eukprot:Sro112_g055860.1 B-type cyclin (338) ;mRNA; f:105835-106951